MLLIRAGFINNVTEEANPVSSKEIKQTAIEEIDKRCKCSTLDGIVVGKAQSFRLTPPLQPKLSHTDITFILCAWHGLKANMVRIKLTTPAKNNTMNRPQVSPGNRNLLLCQINLLTADTGNTIRLDTTCIPKKNHARLAFALAFALCAPSALLALTVSLSKLLLLVVRGHHVTVVGPVPANELCGKVVDAVDLRNSS